ncbi:LmbE family N-acetylglucosaminyl deacetylase [Thermosporothrix hazakensis]|jgi:LmbE family N-acetylglucosaminyl deacetylase|uniref:LmbE family N-acetylglucosaminyl deacetylase n=2 Tax=Thermosporothrix TaxID=768650 RepID=A0A326U669_THEHA|nr:PIG-L family deacetylase [Thermosporothrix hazakensis]PZW28454.1 LmbE family N-acetylglucosaminyl deacetylase [Thermosporothrix hazakensis]BBH86353.1 GlcNAc-PI de-N-acetylase [Thermosporothrix sp. COM3]GCE45232.1 GlcNAc-PI de-N-acetylase [Thermosporothrix hazakensis]
MVLEASQTIVSILAHPDDGESFTGGTVAQLASKGKAIYYLVITRGDKGSNREDLPPEKLVTLREQEQRDAARILGVKEVFFLSGYSDGELEPTLRLRREIVNYLRQLKPDTVFCFDPWKRYELHPDHRAAGIVAVDAVASARDRYFTGITIQEPHNVQRILYFNTDMPNFYVDISAHLETKIQARCAHVSQINPNKHPSTYLTAWAEEAGKAGGYPYAEAFHLQQL